jgi:uncharacterized repeat protein (TIGR02543 family)
VQNLGPVLKVHTVQFTDDNGNVLDVQLILEDADAKAPVAPFKVGYTFKEWDKEFTNIKNDLIVIAVYEANKYTISFDSNGGNEQESMNNIPYNSTITLPIPTKEGYKFLGWFMDSTINAEHFYNTSKIVDNKTLYARWEKIVYVVSFVDFDNKEINRQEVKHGFSAYTPIDPHRIGYEFTGWDKDLNNVTSNLVVKAVYKLLKFKISFESCGGNPIDSIEVFYDAMVSLPDGVLEGYYFDGWLYNDTILDKEFKYTYPENIEVNATWELIVEYNMSFDSNGGDEIDVFKVVNRQLITELPIPTRQDYLFLGWSLEDESIEVPFKYNYDRNVILKANWRTYSNGLSYRIEDDEVTITGFDGKHTDLSIPNTLAGYSVVKISDNVFKDNNLLVTVTVGNNVCEVGNDAFRNMSSLKRISFPNATKTFGTNVLFSSNNLEKITLSSEVRIQFAYLFGEDENNIPLSLSLIKYANGASIIDKHMLESSLNNIALELADDWTEIAFSQFNELNSLSKIIIPANVVSIGENAFRYSNNITSVVFKEGSKLQTIGNSAFYGLNYWNSVVIPDGTISIDNFAFGNSYYLKSLIIPASVTTVGYDIVSSSDQVTIYVGAKELPESWNPNWNSSSRPVLWDYEKSITDGTLMYRVFKDNRVYVDNLEDLAVTSIVIPNTIEGYEVTHIADYAFNFTNMINVIIPASITSIGSHAFENMFSLSNIFIEEGSNLQTIGDSAFYFSSLKSISLPASLKSIGNGSFGDMYRFTNIDFEEGSLLQSIGAMAFNGSNRLKSIEIPASVTSIGRNAFSGNSMLSIYTSLSIIPSGWDPSCNPLNRPVYFNYEKAINEGNILYRVFKDGYAHVDYLINDTLINFTIPNSIDGYVVKYISEYALYQKCKYRIYNNPSKCTKHRK